MIKFATTALIIGAALAGYATTHSIHSAYQNGQAVKRIYSEEATIITENSMNNQQREHAKLYTESIGGKNLVDRAAKKGEISVIIKRHWAPPEEGANVTNDNHLNRLACRSDLVVIGAVRQKFSQLTEKRDFVFTDYDVSIEEILKQGPSSNVLPFAQVVVTKPGGKVSLDGRIIEVIDELAVPFQIGQRYLLFLSQTTSKDTYKTLKGEGVFLISGNQAYELNERNRENASPIEQQSNSTVLAQLRPAITSVCK